MLAKFKMKEHAARMKFFEEYNWGCHGKIEEVIYTWQVQKIFPQDMVVLWDNFLKKLICTNT
jgi:hypothetical protein